MRLESLHANQDRERRRCDGQRDQRSGGQLLRDVEQIADESFFRDVNPEELRHLVQDDHEADACLEARQHGRGHEVGDESQAHQPRQHQHRADQRGERRSRRQKLRRIAVGDYQAEAKCRSGSPGWWWS